MTGALVQQARVRTNTTKDSVCKVDVPVITFQSLWDHYVTGDPLLALRENCPIMPIEI